jgi:flagellar L-ring protein precursor FlgH
LIRIILALAAATLLLPAGGLFSRGGKKPPPPTPLDDYLEQARAMSAGATPPNPGSAYAPGSRWSDLGRDLRAAQPGDLVTIIVNDRANAVSQGSTTADRSSEANARVNSLLGRIPGTNPLANLSGLSGNSKVQGTGETTRSSTLSAMVSARVVEVLPNGNLVLEGRKSVTINSERQYVEVRGVARWNDVSANNQIRSDRIAQLEIRVNGKGVVADAVRRPNFLYRLLLGVMPF